MSHKPEHDRQKSQIQRIKDGSYLQDKKYAGIRSQPRGQQPPGGTAEIIRLTTQPPGKTK